MALPPLLSGGSGGLALKLGDAKSSASLGDRTRVVNKTIGDTPAILLVGVVAVLGLVYLSRR